MHVRGGKCHEMSKTWVLAGSWHEISDLSHCLKQRIPNTRQVSNWASHAVLFASRKNLARYNEKIAESPAAFEHRRAPPQPVDRALKFGIGASMVDRGAAPAEALAAAGIAAIYSYAGRTAQPLAQPLPRKFSLPTARASPFSALALLIPMPAATPRICSATTRLPTAKA